MPASAVNCDQIRDALLEGGAPDTAALERHLKSCEACRELLSAPRVIDSLRSESEGVELSSLGAKVRQGIAQETGLVLRLKSLSTPRRWLLGLGLVVGLWLLEGTLLARADLHLVPNGLLYPILLTLSALFAWTTWATLRPIYRAALPVSAEVALIALCLVVPVVLAFMQPDTGHPEALKGTGAEFFRHAAICLSHGLALAGLVWLALRALDRRALDAGATPWLAGGAGVVVATLALQLHCPIAVTGHWLLGHAGVGLAVVAALSIWRNLSGKHR